MPLNVNHFAPGTLSSRKEQCIRVIRYQVKSNRYRVKSVKIPGKVKDTGK